MNLVNETMKGYLANSSMIRRMFEAGLELKKKYGEDKVYDFSLGNPDLPHWPNSLQKNMPNSSSLIPRHCPMRLKI